MARYLVLEFDDDRTCNKLVEQIEKATQAGKKFRVVGVFQQPRKLCECGPMTEEQQSRESVMGGKYGWFIHRTCRKPRSIYQSPANLYDTQLEGLALKLGGEDGSLTYRGLGRIPLTSLVTRFLTQEILERKRRHNIPLDQPSSKYI